MRTGVIHRYSNHTSNPAGVIQTIFVCLKLLGGLTRTIPTKILYHSASTIPTFKKVAAPIPRQIPNPPPQDPKFPSPLSALLERMSPRLCSSPAPPAGTRVYPPSDCVLLGLAFFPPFIPNQKRFVVLLIPSCLPRQKTVCLCPCTCVTSYYLSSYMRPGWIMAAAGLLINMTAIPPSTGDFLQSHAASHRRSSPYFVDCLRERRPSSLSLFLFSTSSVLCLCH